MKRIALGALSIMALVQLGAAPAAAQSAMCRDPQAFCGRQISESCLSRLGAGAIAAGGDESGGACAAQAELYRDCLSLVAGQCGGGTVAPQAGASRGDQASMLAIWAEVKDSDSPAALEAFAKSYPDTPLAALATERAAALRVGASPRPAVEAPTAPAAISPERASLLLQEIVARETRCQKEALDTPAGRRAATLFITDVEDPSQARKMEIDALLEADLVADVIEHRNKASACQARFLGDVSDFSAQLVAMTANMLAQQERLLADAVARELTIGEVNMRAAAMALALQQQATGLFLNAAATGAWAPGGAAEQAEARRALDQWTAAQKRLAQAAPATRIFACSWSAGGVSC